MFSTVGHVFDKDWNTLQEYIKTTLALYEHFILDIQKKDSQEHELLQCFQAGIGCIACCKIKEKPTETE